MPHFIVIVAQKAGTSSVFAYLKQHHQIVRPVFKEIYYFDRHYNRGLGWYGCNFPARAAIERLNDRRGRPHLTFEATATYIFGEEVPKRIAGDIETKKFVALLRDPADRAISAYWHARRMGREQRTLDRAIKMDLDWYAKENAFERGQGPRPAGGPPRPTYVRRGIYHESISRWLGAFGRENLLVVQSEAMFADPRAAMDQILGFVGLPPSEHIDYRPHNVGGYRETDAEARRPSTAARSPTITMER